MGRTQPGRADRYKETPPIQVEAASEHSDISKVYHEMARDPNGFFIQRDNKKCFLRNNSLIKREEKKLTVFDSIKYL
jgi:hypothetical protein